MKPILTWMAVGAFSTALSGWMGSALAAPLSTTAASRDASPSISRSASARSPQRLAQGRQVNWRRLEKDIIAEQNRLRQNPQSYIPILQDYLSTMDAQGNIPGGCGPRCTLRTFEGQSAVREAIAFLRQQSPRSALDLSSAAAQASRDHATDQQGGATGHNGSDGSSLRDRLKLAGLSPSSWGENITYGPNTAQGVVMNLLIDDGVPSRGHRDNIFANNWNQAGAGCGPHAKYRTVCVIDYIQDSPSSSTAATPSTANNNRSRPGSQSSTTAQSSSTGQSSNGDDSGASEAGRLSQGQIQELLDSHNAYRQEVGLPNLTWSAGMAANAQAWADQIAAKNQFQHSRSGSQYRDRGHGENIAYGRGGRRSLKSFVELWGAEKKNFQNGVMPNISKTGNWADAGHYSQIVWGDTTELGCGFARNRKGAEYLVCQYNPSGNVMGRQAF